MKNRKHSVLFVGNSLFGPADLHPLCGKDTQSLHTNTPAPDPVDSTEVLQ